MGDMVQTHASASPSSPVPAARSSLLVEEDGNKQFPTFEEWKSDAQIQVEVAKRLHQYKQWTRTEQGFEGKSTDAIKSGRYRACIRKVLHTISWVQDFSTTVNDKQPTYDDLSALQWVQGFVYCL